MAEITAAFGSSHSIMLAARREDWIEGFRKSDLRLPYFNRQGERITFEQVLAAARADAAPEITTERISTRFDEVQAAMAEMKRRVEAAPIDVLVIVGDDQYELFHDQHMPAIGIYYGETIRNAKRSPVPPAELAWYDEARMRRLEIDAERHYACHRPLALALIEGLVEREFDVAAMASLGAAQYEGHAYSFVHRWYLSDRALPIVPIFVNTYNPPNPPTPRRCVNFGRALKAVIESYPEPLRVGVMASGGLSHFIVEEDLDRGVIDAIHRRDMGALEALDVRRLKAGSSEIRNWIIVAAAAIDLDLDWVSYTPAYRTPALTGTGLGFAAWRPKI